MSFSNRFAFLVSSIFSPFLIVPATILVVVARVADDLNEFLLFSGVALVFLGVIPALYILLEVRARRITDVHIQDRNQRSSVFLVFLVSALLNTIVYYLIDAPNTLKILAVLALMSGIVAALITLFWKISIHTLVVGGVIAVYALLMEDEWAWGAFTVLVPLVVWARLRRHRHTFWQATIGAITGVMLAWLVYYIFSVK